MAQYVYDSDECGACSAQSTEFSTDASNSDGQEDSNSCGERLPFSDSGSSYQPVVENESINHIFDENFKSKSGISTIDEEDCKVKKYVLESSYYEVTDSNEESSEEEPPCDGIVKFCNECKICLCVRENEDPVFKTDEPLRILCKDDVPVIIPHRVVMKIPFFQELRTENASNFIALDIRKSSTLESLVKWCDLTPVKNLTVPVEAIPLHYREPTFVEDDFYSKECIYTKMDRSFCEGMEIEDVIRLLNLANALNLARLVQMLCRYISTTMENLSLLGHIADAFDVHRDMEVEDMNRLKLVRIWKRNEGKKQKFKHCDAVDAASQYMSLDLYRSDTGEIFKQSLMENEEPGGYSISGPVSGKLYHVTKPDGYD